MAKRERGDWFNDVAGREIAGGITYFPVRTHKSVIIPLIKNCPRISLRQFYISIGYAVIERHTS